MLIDKPGPKSAITLEPVRELLFLSPSFTRLMEYGRASFEVLVKEPTGVLDIVQFGVSKVGKFGRLTRGSKVSFRSSRGSMCSTFYRSTTDKKAKFIPDFIFARGSHERCDWACKYIVSSSLVLK